DIYEARQIRDAEAADPGVVRRALDAKIEAGEEPTKAALREAVLEAARQGYRPTVPSNKNPHYRAPTQAGAAWQHLYGNCRALVEWASEEALQMALNGRTERSDDQSANMAAVRKCADILNRIVGTFDAH
ncbi:hypothetical protein RXR53_28095, partial [Pseudomonas aeruginosa]|nr:hypothetical protein [Pseudomonas aeruginosa]